MPEKPTDSLHSAPPRDEAAAPLAGAKILVVDDNEQNLELIEAYLDDLGCRVTLARDGLDALARVADETPDAIVLDVMMPRMSGFQACSRLKADAATSHIPVLMVTALNEVGDVERAVECGADDFLTKPVQKADLIARVRAQVEVRRARARADASLAALRAAADALSRSA